MAPTSTSSNPPESKAEAEELLPQFQLERVLNQDQNGRRISLLGTIASQPALITLERAAFPTDAALVSSLLESLTQTTNLGANDIYRWYMANRSIATTDSNSISDLKLNLIYPCTPQHVRKYSAQRTRMVTETPTVYAQHIRPYMARQRASGRLDWVFNILEGRTEQEDVISRVDWDASFDPSNAAPSSPPSEGFLLLPDLNWDRRSVEGMHLLALVQRRDIWSLRDLRATHAPWLRRVRSAIVAEVVDRVFPGGQIEADEIKCYVHYQPTYYHFHIHVVHVMLEAEGHTQSVGKAFGLANLIAQLEAMPTGSSVLPALEGGVGADGDSEKEEKQTQAPGMDGVELTYFLGEESELWKRCFGPLKNGERVDLND